MTQSRLRWFPLLVPARNTGIRWEIQYISAVQGVDDRSSGDREHVNTQADISPLTYKYITLSSKYIFAHFVEDLAPRSSTFLYFFLAG